MHQLFQWLMSGDASIRYQTSRDLLGSPKDEIREHQMYIEIEGWGKQLLDLQDENGLWADDLIDPEWTATIWTLTELRRMGLSRNDIKANLAASLLLEKGLQADGGINYWEDWGKSEVCISGLVLSSLSYFRVVKRQRDSIFEFLIESQMDDGGWNCLWKKGATHSSFHSTLVVLEALREYSTADRKNSSLVNYLQKEAHDFLLNHHLFLSHTTGNIVSNSMLELVYPNYWYYDVLAALDYFQSIDHHYDKRFRDAIVLIKQRQSRNGWLLDNKHKGQTWFDMESVGKPSRWNTLRALRVLKWWEKVSKFKLGQSN